jgi:hypothetical protein
VNTKNPRHWFRAKRYGLGWGLPLAWQGWAFLFSWMLIIPLDVRFLAPGTIAAAVYAGHRSPREFDRPQGDAVGFARELSPL